MKAVNIRKWRPLEHLPFILFTRKLAPWPTKDVVDLCVTDLVTLAGTLAQPFQVKDVSARGCN